MPANRHLHDLPPRRINLFTKATVLCGGFFQQFGWIFFCMGSLFAWLFVPASDVRFWFEFGKEWKETPGKVVTAEPTNSAVNDQVVYSYLHSFELDGQRFTGKSFSVGQQFREGQEVSVRYDAVNPSDSHVAGSRRAVFPAFVLFVLLFPLVGLGFIVHSVRQNLRAVQLLEIGDFTRGVMKSKEATGSVVKINNTTYPVFKYQFGFEAGGKQHTATCKTHRGWLVEDEEREIILYDRFNPGFNLVFDAAPNMPSISGQGTLEPAPLRHAVYLLLPLAGVALNLFFLWWGAPLSF